MTSHGGRKKKEKKHKNSQSHNFLRLVEEMNKGCFAAKAHSTRQNYMTAALSIANCLGKGLTIEELTTDTIDGYQAWLKRHDICLNTISCYMRSLRTIYNHAVRDLGIEDKTPFRNAFTGKTKTDKRAITEKEIKAVAHLELRRGSQAELSRDIFLFSVYAMGMPFVDMAFLKKSQISGNRFTYYRHKTGQRIAVGIEPCMAQIIRKYAKMTTGDYVFPILNSSQTTDADDIYAARLAQYNRNLAAIARMLDIPKLTSYVARHTWASIAYGSNVDLSVISKGMGHTNTNTTLVYVKEINDTRLHRANSEIIARLTEK